MSANFKGKVFIAFSNLPAQANTAGNASGFVPTGMPVVFVNPVPFGGATYGYPPDQKTEYVDSATGWIKASGGVTLAADPEQNRTYVLQIPGQPAISFPVADGGSYRLGDVVYGATNPPSAMPFGITGTLRKAVGDIGWTDGGVIRVELVDIFANDHDMIFIRSTKEYRIGTGGVIDIPDLMIPLVPSVVAIGGPGYKAHYRITLPDPAQSRFEMYLNSNLSVGTSVDIKEVMDGDYANP